MLIWLELFYLFILLSFLAVLGLPCCVRAFSSCGKWGLLSVAVCKLLIVVASLVAEHGSRCMGFIVAACGLSSMGSVVVAQGLSCPMARWDFSRPGIEPVFPALAGKFFWTTREVWDISFNCFKEVLIDFYFIKNFFQKKCWSLSTAYLCIYSMITWIFSFDMMIQSYPCSSNKTFLNKESSPNMLLEYVV